MKNKGFSLLEVLLACSLLVGILPVFLYFLSQCFFLLNAEDRVTDVYVLRDQIRDQIEEKALFYDDKNNITPNKYFVYMQKPERDLGFFFVEDLEILKSEKLNIKKAWVIFATATNNKILDKQLHIEIYNLSPLDFSIEDKPIYQFYLCLKK